jgi:serine/threonine-protein kinase HipA
MNEITRQGAVYANEKLAGLLTEYLSEERLYYSFQYHPDYLETKKPPIGHSLPLQAQPFEFDVFPPFFENLLSEGWIKMYQTAKTRLDKRDEFGLLLHNGRVLIGALSIINMEKEFVTL